MHIVLLKMSQRLFLCKTSAKEKIQGTHDLKLSLEDFPVLLNNITRYILTPYFLKNELMKD